MTLHASGFRLQASGFRLQASGFRLQASGFRLQAQARASGSKLPASRRGRRLSFDTGQRRVDTGPTWRLRRPDGGSRPSNFAIVEGARAHENEMGPRLGLAEHLGAAGRTKAAVHDISAVGHTAKAAKLAVNSDRAARKTHVDGAITRPKILTEPTPTHARDDGRRRNPITNGAA